MNESQPAPLSIFFSRSASSLASPRWIGRVLAVGIFAWIFVFLAWAVWRSFSPPVNARVVESPLKPWDGAWRGEMKVYRWTGEPVRSLRVEREFRHVADPKMFRQEGRIASTDPDTGEVAVEEIVQTAEFDGTRLRRQSLRDDGTRVVAYRGRFEGGYLFWSQRVPGTAESFRTWVEGDRLFVEGVGYYETEERLEMLVYVGRFERKPPAAEAGASEDGQPY